MARPKIDYIPKGLTVDLEETYAGYFKQEVEFRPENKEDFLYMLRLLERWEKKSIPAVLAKGGLTLRMPLRWGCANICHC